MKVKLEVRYFFCNNVLNLCQHCRYGFVVFLRQGMADDQHLKIPLISWINQLTLGRVCV